MRHATRRFGIVFVLIVDSDLEEGALFSRIIREKSYEAVFCNTYQLAEKFLALQNFELALVDIDLSPSGLSWLQRCAILAPQVQIVTLTWDTSREQEIQARNNDISMYLVRPVSKGVIEMIMEHLVEKLHKKSIAGMGGALSLQETNS